jgi:hypothetical protein
MARSQCIDDGLVLWMGVEVGRNLLIWACNYRHLGISPRVACREKTREGRMAVAGKDSPDYYL